MIPWITKAQVVSAVPPDSVNVLLPSGQMPGFPVKVMMNGPADALRVNQQPLPTPGTWGLVVFPAANQRNGVWLGSFYAQSVNAFTVPDDAHMKYISHWSGHYETLDKDGNSVTYHPDGTYVIVGSMNALPPTYRQTVAPDQTQQSTEFTPADRVSSKPSPYYITVAHASGASLEITPAGQINVTAAPGQTVNFSQEGNAVNDALVLVSKMVSAFNAHVHPDPESGNTGTPSTQLTAADIESAVVKTSG